MKEPGKAERLTPQASWPERSPYRHEENQSAIFDAPKPALTAYMQPRIAHADRLLAEGVFDFRIVDGDVRRRSRSSLEIFDA